MHNLHWMVPQHIKAARPVHDRSIMNESHPTADSRHPTRALMYNHHRSLIALFTAVLIIAGTVACSPTTARDHVDLLTLDWDGVDIGSIGATGESTPLGGPSRWVIRAAGQDIWGTEDSFHFVYFPFAGDFDFKAQVSSVEFTHEWAKAGLMVRESLDARSKHAFIGLTPTGVAEFLRRQAEGSETTATTSEDWPLESWVRLQRRGGTVTGFISQDGQSWQQVDSVSNSFSRTALVGIAVTSHTPVQLTEARLEGLRLSTDLEPGGEPPVQPPTPTPTPTPEQPAPQPPTGPDTPPGGGWYCSDVALQPSYSPTFYVSTDGSDSNDGRSPEAAFRTLQRAARVVNPGDVVWVRGGVYSSDVAFERSGRADAPIVYESYPGECAIFDGTGLDRLQRLQFWNVEHNVFRNFVVRNSPGEGIYVRDSHRNVFSNLLLHNNYLSGYLSMYSNENLLQWIITHDNYDAPGGGDADGISISSGNGNRIANCIAYRNSDDGVDTWLSTNSLVEYCVSFENGFQGGDGNGFKAGGDNRNVNTVVRFSISFGNRSNGFDWNTGTGVTFDNNTSFNNGRYGFTANSATVRNNLSIGNGSGNFSGDADRNELVTNSWMLGMNDVRFTSTDPSSPDFLAVPEGSPVIGAGTDIGYSRSAGRPTLGALGPGESLLSLIGIRSLQGF